MYARRCARAARSARTRCAGVNESASEDDEGGAEEAEEVDLEAEQAAEAAEAAAGVVPTPATALLLSPSCTFEDAFLRPFLSAPAAPVPFVSPAAVEDVLVRFRRGAFFLRRDRDASVANEDIEERGQVSTIYRLVIIAEL